MDSDGCNIISAAVSGSNLTAGIIICIVLILLRAFFTCCETACTEISDGKVKSFENEKGGKGLLFRLLSHPSELISAFSAHRILNAVILTIAAEQTLFAPFYSCFAGVFPAESISVPVLIITELLIIFCTVLAAEVFGGSIPKKLIKSPDSFAVRCAPAVKLISVLMKPFTLVSSLAARLTAAASGSPAEDADAVTEEEIRLMVDAGNETGSIESSEREMINNVFEFHELTVSDVMTHRTDIVAVEIGAEISEAVYTAINSGFSRIPVYRDNIDHIEGVIYVKDLLCLIGTHSSESMTLKSFLRDAAFVPESCMCGDLFKRFTARKLQMAVAVDEYGGTAGLVTMEDLVESIVGNIQDEYDNEAEEITKISDNTYTISGTADAADVMEALGAPLPEDSEYDTMSGFVTDLLGRIPEDGETPSVTYKNITFTVLLAEDMRIVRIKAVINKEEKEIEKNEEISKEQKD